jgi:hypothetical protein
VPGRRTLWFILVELNVVEQRYGQAVLAVLSGIPVVGVAE